MLKVFCERALCKFNNEEGFCICDESGLNIELEIKIYPFFPEKTYLECATYQQRRQTNNFTYVKITPEEALKAICAGEIVCTKNKNGTYKMIKNMDVSNFCSILCYQEIYLEKQI